MAIIHSFCSHPFNKIKVNPSGHVSMCCYQRGALGNIFTQSFEAFWQGPIARAIRETTLALELHRACEGWGCCPYVTNPRTPKAVETAETFPTSLELDLPNTHCNIGGESPRPETACFMCPRAAPQFAPQVDRTVELVERLRFLMPHLTVLRVQGVAEPFWKDRVFEILELFGFRDFNHRCLFSTYTNGSLLNVDRRRRFLELCPRSAVFVSLDAASPDTYRRIRRLDLFDQIVANIRGFVCDREPGQQVDIANNLNLVNLHEAVQMVELASELKVDCVQFNPTHDGGFDRNDLRHLLVGADTCRQFDEAQRQISSRASQLGVRVTFVRPLALGYATEPYVVAAFSTRELPLLT